jgi:protein involved in polysaccharide export with SLBB domain
MMKKIIILLTLFLTTIFAQISASDLDKISNKQLDAIRGEIRSEDMDDFDIQESSTSKNLELISPEIVSIDTELDKDDESEYFGYNYFRKDIKFFDNMPTPYDYKLGPGDEIILSLWGETNIREQFIINKNGMIYYDNVGFINLANQTLNEAETVLYQALSSIYSTLKDKENPTKLMLELGELKSINVYFSGEIDTPGIHLIHPFSDIFASIVQAGGVTENGSLRNIQLIRNGQIVSSTDFYSFFMDGKNNFANTRIIDGDVIHIPSSLNHIKVIGAVNRGELFYELLDNESIDDLIRYAGGFTSLASSNIIIDTVIPIEERISNDNAQSSISIDFRNAPTYSLNNTYKVNVMQIGDVDSEVIIYGRVKNPGKYPSKNNTLKNVLDIAGGFDDPIFRQTIREDEIFVLRQDGNQFYSKEIPVAYKDADQFTLMQNDKIFVYENVNYNNSFTYRVEGEVFKPGTYPINDENITVGEALSLAGGLTALTSARNLTVKQEFTELDDEGNEVTSSEVVNNVTLDFEIGINSVIIASPFENVVRVEGNVYNPGLITFTKGYRYPKYIELAGGYRSDTLRSKTYIRRANGNIEKVKGFFISRGKKLYPGDTIIVPVNPNPRDFDITAFISDLSTTLANIAAILLIVDNQTD